MTEVEIRTAKPADMPFVFSTWQKTYVFSSDFSRRVRKEFDQNKWFLLHHRMLEHILARPTCEVSIATPSGDPDVILGYLVSEKQKTGAIIHFAYTKNTFRRLGIMTTLLQSANIDPNQCVVSHWTPEAEALKTKWPGLAACMF